MVVDWPQGHALPVERGPVPRAVAEEMPRILGRLQASAQWGDGAVLGDPLRWWWMHYTLLRKASWVVWGKQELARAEDAQAEDRHEFRMLALARALWGRDLHIAAPPAPLGLFWPVLVAGSDGCRLANPALCGQQLVAAVLGVAAKMAQRVGRECRAGSARAKACAKQDGAGALREAQMWQPRRPMLRLSGARIIGSTGVTEALKLHFLPVFQAAVGARFRGLLGGLGAGTSRSLQFRAMSRWATSSAEAGGRLRARTDCPR